MIKLLLLLSELKKEKQSENWYLVLLFALLSVASFTGNKSILTFAGYEGIICGSFAFYEAAALIINEKFGKLVLPL